MVESGSDERLTKQADMTILSEEEIGWIPNAMNSFNKLIIAKNPLKKIRMAPVDSLHSLQ